MLYALCAALALALLGLDQWVKHYVTVHIPLGEAQPLLPGLVELRTVHNYGAAWSSLAGMRWLLVAITGVIIAAVAVILIRRIVRHPVGVMAGFLILSGGLGNIVDRVRLGYVVDMFHLEFWPSYPVFNVADICVVCGALLGAVYYLWFYEKYDRKGGDHGDADAASGI
ncbi:signal peptidase II [Oscillibacter valericigenes]|uniref:signal peptidase II n=1 Tax=Oscillibacter valericigenes TaxID=351091 RepID=UPI001957191B|nr:signal peptidase II [Oscillibacter valericigenes]MBM6911191.1 signal peptidase II [Oscillibacter valericigenes]